MKQTIFHNTKLHNKQRYYPRCHHFANSEKQHETHTRRNSLEPLTTQTNNKVINDTPPKINAQEQTLPRYTRRSLAQLRANKCPLLIEYLYKISPDTHPTPMCPLCNAHTHNTNHLCACQHIHTSLTPISLWENPVGGGGLSFPLVCGLDRQWEGPFDQDGLAEGSTPPPSRHFGSITRKRYIMSACKRKNRQILHQCVENVKRFPLICQ